MNPFSKVLFDLFERTGGDVTVSDSDGTTFTSDNLEQVAGAAFGMEDPWLDLVTSTGEAIGIFAPGDPKAVIGEITPSIELVDGMIFMLDGDAITGQKLGQHLAPLSEIADRYEIDLPFYLPADLDVKTAASSMPITLMRGRRRDESQGKWKEIESTFDAFADVLLAHSEGEKDGPCFLQGQSADGQRKSAAQIANYILGVDLDSGAPLGDVMATIQKAGLEAIIYTTHSHLKDTSVIKRDHFLKKMGATDADPDLIRQYLVEYKGMLPAIVEELEVIDDAKHTGEGVVILVQHNPVPKFRAVFPLTEPFIFAKRGGSQQDAILEWKERYAGFCTKLGFFFDEKCVDPARLFYFPRHAAGDSRFNTLRIIGKPLNLDDYDRIKMSRRSRRPAGPVNAFTAAAGDVGGDSDDEADRYVTKAGFNLRGWAMRYAKKFEVQTMLEDAVGGDFIREPRQGKPGTHVECPFEAEHTNLGGGGTYVVNAGDNFDDGFDGGFTFHCVHNACAGRDRLDFLKELIDEEIISVEDLTAKEYLLELEEEEEDARSAPARSERTRARPVTPAAPKARASDRGRVAGGRDDDRGEIEVDDEIVFECEDDVIAYMNAKYAVTRGAGGVKILVEPTNPEDDVTFETQNDVALFERNKFLWVGGNKDGTGAKKVEAFKVWIESPRRRTFDSVVFHPGRRAPRNIYNLFRGWPIQPIETTWVNVLDNRDTPVEGDWSMLRGHIYENICESNPRYFNWFMTWLAMLVQQADGKPGSTVVITGEKGTGKSTVFDYVNQLLGRHGITVSQRKQIVGQFNSHIATALLMVCEEAFWAADPQAEGVLKDLITNKSVLIEKKGRDPIQSLNYTRLALISNSEWVVPATLKDERRFFVLRCSTARQGDLAFFRAVREQMEEKGGLQAMMSDLLAWEPVGGNFDCLYTPPHTDHLKQQQMETLSGIQKFMLELIRSGIYETNDERVPAIELNEEIETVVPAVDMRACVEDYVRYRFASDKAKTSFDDISAVVRDWFGAREVKVKPDGSVNSRRMFIFPPLGAARAIVKEKKGIPIETMTVEEVKAMRAR